MRILNYRVFNVLFVALALLAASCASSDTPPAPAAGREQPASAATTLPDPEPSVSQPEPPTQQPDQDQISAPAGSTASEAALQTEPPDQPATTAAGAPPASGADVAAARTRIKSAVDSVIAPPGAPQQLTNAELGCLSASVLDSLTDERLIELAPEIISGLVADGLPASVLTDAETDLILGAASGCVDWPAAMNRSFLTAGSPQPQEPPPCLLEAAEAGHFSREAARLMLFDTGNPARGVAALVGEGCFTEAIRTQAVQTMTAEGVSDESAQCFADGTVELLLSADSDSAGSYEEFLAMGMLSAMLDCLTEAEIEQLSGGPQ